MKISHLFLAVAAVVTCTAVACGGNGVPEDALTPQEFEIRVPEQDSLNCQSVGEDYFLAQVDFVCRIDNAQLVADLYIQSSPTDCGEWGNPTYVADNAWLKIDGEITETSGEYEFGGRHHNDMIAFMHEGARHMLWHSSIGWGWRACAAPDCLVVCTPGSDCVVDSTENVAVDGCLRDAGDPRPPLGAICVQVSSDGTVPTFDDPWTTPDPYAQKGEMILPCAGEESMEL